MYLFIFFSIRVFFHIHWQLTGQQGKGGDHLIQLYNFHPFTNIQTFICNFAREMTIIFLIATLVFTRLPLDEICHLIELLFDWLTVSFVCLLLWFWVLLQYLTGETGGLELTSTIILVLQANRQTKCSSHPMMYSFDISFQKNTSQR